jgi:hypothetical protein
MTIGVGFLLDDRVILIADGKTVSLPDYRLVADDTDKIEFIGDHAFAISFGVERATKTALQLLRRHFDPSSKLEDIRDLAYGSVKRGFAEFEHELGPQVDRTNPELKASLIIAGIVQDTPFLTASLCGFGTSQVPLLISRSPDCIFLGGEEHSAKTMFAAKCSQFVDENLRLEVLSEKILDACRVTIREIERSDPVYGGTIRYVTVIRGQASTRGILYH